MHKAARLSPMRSSELAITAIVCGFSVRRRIAPCRLPTRLVQTRRLSRPVVSVGNLTVGGTGKTPLVVCIAKILLRRGWKPSILTEGTAAAARQR